MGIGMQIGSQEIPGVTDKFGLEVQKEAGQRLREFCQENTLVIANTLFQHVPSYLGFSYLGCGVSLHDCSSKAQLLLLTLDEGYLLTAALPDLQCGIAPLGPPAPVQPGLLGCGPWAWGHGVVPSARRP